MNVTHSALSPETPQERTDFIPQITEGLGGLRFHDVPKGRKVSKDFGFLERIGRLTFALLPTSRSHGAHSEAHALRPAAQVIDEIKRMQNGAAYSEILVADQIRRSHLGEGQAALRLTLLTQGSAIRGHQEQGVNSAYLTPTQDQTTQSSILPHHDLQ
jgi:hypothetical protein